MTRLPAFLAVAVACVSAAFAVSAPGGRIAFSSASGVGGAGQIWVMNVNGTRRHAVSAPTVDEGSPALSPNGRLIAFGRHNDIYVMRSDGSHVRRLTLSSTRALGAPAWSPSGAWIAYSSYRAGQSDIWKMRADGSHETRLTHTGQGPGDSVPGWSPDGRRIAYAGGAGRIYLVNADGTRQHALTRHSTGFDWAPDWSPDGRRIAYESDRATSPTNPTNEVWLMNADGSHQVRLTTNLLNDGQPAWSPDGRWIAFTSQLPHLGTNHIWVMRPNGQGLHRVSSSTGEEFYPSWSK